MTGILIVTATVVVTVIETASVTLIETLTRPTQPDPTMPPREIQLR